MSRWYKITADLDKILLEINRMRLHWLTSIIAAKVVEINDSDASNDNITNIVVLMMENRSFDTFLGRLKKDGLNPDVNGITERMVNYVDELPVGTRNVEDAPNPGLYDPGHYVGDVTEQIYGPGNFNGNVAGKQGNMSGFAQNVMRHFADQNLFVDKCFTQVFGLHGPETLPVTYALAQEFSVVDDWYSSVPGPTYPNRHFLQCATALGKTSNNLNYVRGLKCKTIFENLSDNDISWNVYSDGLFASTALYSYFRNPVNQARVRDFRRFKHDAKRGRLPQYSFIDPDFQKSILNLMLDDNHPPHKISSGEGFLKEVYETLRASPQWESTLLIVTYDEHGGHYDRNSFIYN